MVYAFIAVIAVLGAVAYVLIWVPLILCFELKVVAKGEIS